MLITAIRDALIGLSQVPWHIWAIGIGFVLIVLLLWRLPKRKAARLTSGLKEQFNIENEIRKTWATIIGGMAVLFSLLFTWANLRVAQDNLRSTQEAATKSQELTREGQITDRFTKAITQLGEQGPEKLAVRLGGIYALERIARDSERDHWPIMEVLTAYVREHVPWRPKDTQLQKSDQLPANGQPSLKPATDIQAILTVLGRRVRGYDPGEDQRLHLADTDLRGADLGNVHLERADLGNAHLERAYLVRVHLEEAILWNAHLEGVYIWNAHLERANLSGADLEEAILYEADLRGANLRGAHLKGANLQGAYLEGAHNLTVEQLCSVSRLYLAQLDPPLTEQIRQQCPRLLEEPQK
jgi:hypothetical protein